MEKNQEIKAVNNAKNILSVLLKLQTILKDKNGLF